MMITTDAAVQYIQILLTKPRYREPNVLTRAQANMTHQNMRIVCQALGMKSSFQRDMAERINCPPEKLMEVVTLQRVWD